MNSLRKLMIILLIVVAQKITAKEIEKWGVFEISTPYNWKGNPFVEVTYVATFTHDSLEVKVKGFYDGNNTFKLRFMPTETGEWSYVTNSNLKKLNNQKGRFICIEPKSDNHGYVQVKDTFHFSYADGNSYFPIGTTAYAWHLQNDTLCEHTLKTLKESPFNKIRMCVFPKKYQWIFNEPKLYPFEKKSSGEWDFERFNPVYFQDLEEKIFTLGELGIEADLILFHPYDYSWGFDKMDSLTDIRYLDYIIARLSSYRNIWWSMGNEYDLIKSKDDDRWDSYFQFIQSNDPYGHLLSVHNGPRWYDHSKPWITHLSLQHKELEGLVKTRDKYQKPILIDECGYEGNIPWEWGNLTAEELVHRFWLGISRGCYVAAHGETYLDDNDILWWSKGGSLKGESVERINFIKEIIDSLSVTEFNPVPNGYWRTRGGSCHKDEIFLFYTGNSQPKYIEVDLPTNQKYQVEIINTWEMTVEKYHETVSGKSKITLPQDTHLAIICKRIKGM